MISWRSRSRSTKRRLPRKWPKTRQPSRELRLRLTHWQCVASGTDLPSDAQVNHRAIPPQQLNPISAPCSEDVDCAAEGDRGQTFLHPDALNPSAPLRKHLE